jgi:hypothetical protein
MNRWKWANVLSNRIGGERRYFDNSLGSLRRTMSNVGAAIAVGLGLIAVGLLGCRALKRRHRTADPVALLDERDALLIDSLDELLMRRELVPVQAHAAVFER